VRQEAQESRSKRMRGRVVAIGASWV